MTRGWSLLSLALLVSLLSCAQGCGTINAQLLLLKGNQLYDSGQYPEALAKYEQGLEQAHGSSVKVKKIIGDLWANMAMLLNVKLSQYERALACYQQALAIRKDIKDRKGEANILSSLGNVYEKLTRYDQALENYQQALAIHREIGDRQGEGNDLGNMGEACLNFGQYDRALEYLQQALTIRREIKDRRGEGNDLSNIGLVYRGLNQYERALEYHQQALAIRREVGDPWDEAVELNRLGLVYGYLQQDKQYLEYLQQSLAIFKKIENRMEEAALLNNLGVAYQNKDQFEPALEYHQQALAIRRELKDRFGVGESLLNMGNIYYGQGQYDRSLKTLQESLKICREMVSPERLWRTQQSLGAVEFKLANYGEGLMHYRQALDTIEGLRATLGKENKTTFMKDKFYVYDELIELLRSLHEKEPGKGYDRDSLEIFERKQGRLFLEEMGQSGARNFAGLPDQVRSQEAALEDRLDSLQATLEKERAQPQADQQRLQTLETELQQVRAAFQTFKAELQAKCPDYYALKYPQPAKLAELQAKVLKPGEVLLVYGVMEDKTCLWMIGKEVCRLYTLPIGQKNLGRKIAAYRRLVLKTGDEAGQAAGAQDPDETGRDQLRHELYRLLFPAPVQSTLAACRRLYIIPTGPLYALPFEALETQAPGEPPHYLVEEYAVAYLSSASLLKTLREAQTRKQAQPSYPLLAFANPRYGKVSGAQAAKDQSVRGLQTRAYLKIMRGSFAELPETEDEAREIKNILKAPEQSNPLIVKEAASRSTVFRLNQAARLPAYRYLVFACHGILPGEMDRVVQPALVLADPENDGYLTMGDVFGLQLNADLVSLSACNTGRGSEVMGEGVVGLTRAFMYAGTPAVSVTLWSVESGSAKELNVGMYRYLAQGQGRAEALRQIKLALLRSERSEQYRTPFFWAPLVVFGDGQ